MEFTFYTNEENLKKMVAGELFDASVHIDDDFDIMFKVDGRHIRSVKEQTNADSCTHVSILPDFLVANYELKATSIHGSLTGYHE